MTSIQTIVKGMLFGGGAALGCYGAWSISHAVGYIAIGLALLMLWADGSWEES